MAKKSYRQHCGLARALDVVGERWTLLLVRNLLLGPKRYSDLLAELPGITTNLLAKRVQELEELEILKKEQLPAPLGVTVYRLTDAGRALEPVVMELARWGGRFMAAPRRGDTVNLGWALLSLKRRYQGGLSCTVQVCAGERRFTLGFSASYLSVEERASDRPELSIAGEVGALCALFFGGAAWARLEQSGKVVITGPKTLARDVERALEPPAPSSGVTGGDQRRKITRRKLSSRNSSVSSKREV